MQPDVLMVDGVGTDVPAILARFGRNHPVQGYLWQPGMLPYIPWTPAQLAEFPGHILTATMPGRPDDAKWARELDVGDVGDATDEDVAPWLISRHDHGRDDGQIYVDLSGLAGVLAEIESAGLWNEPWWRIRIAWYWGRRGAPTLSQVMDQIDAWTGTLKPAPRRIWACQYFAGGSYDLNAIYGIPDFTRTHP